MRPNSTDRQTRGKVLKDGQSKQSRPPVANKTIARRARLRPNIAAQNTTDFPTEPDPSVDGDERWLIYTLPDATKLRFRLYNVLKRLEGIRCFVCTKCHSRGFRRTIHVSADGRFFLKDPKNIEHVCFDSAAAIDRTPRGIVNARRPTPICAHSMVKTSTYSTQTKHCKWQNNDRSSDSEEEEDVAREKGQSPADVAHAEATPHSDQTATTTTPSQRSVPAGPAAGRVPAIKQETDNNGNAEDATRPVAHSCPRFRIPPPFNAPRLCASAKCPRRFPVAPPHTSVAEPRHTAAGPRPSAAGSPAWLQNVMPLVESELAALDPARSVEIRHGLLGFIYRELVPKFGRGQYQS